ncbi:chloride channel protein [Capnocytophaga sp.]|uniref:chloride channel protein n=1 Tax=Capnocytophaga sp. TaxID=44737 RepID=UPI0026DA9EF2|nr:chloride channel protein [Capnocytophaga sp.]MDO5106594.1 chloride channel protein [Capnocytophaga sp.]
MKTKRTWLVKFLSWKSKHLNHKQFILILCAIIGIVSGVMAIFIKKLTLLIQTLLNSGIVSVYHRAFYFLFPTIGFLLVYFLLKYVVRRRVEAGIPYTLYAISKLKGILPSHHIYGSLLTAPFTAGFGGSVGLEGPMVISGASFSSYLSRFFHINQSERMLLIACACSATMAAMFKAPIAAIIFAIEVFSLDLTLSSLLPLMVSSLLAVLTSYFFFGNEILLPINLDGEFSLNDVPYYILLGLLAGLASIYFCTIFQRITAYFEEIDSDLKRLFFGGLMLGLVIFFIPPLYGEGFEVMNALIGGNPTEALQNAFKWDTDNPWSIIALLAGLVLFKVVAMATTVGSGGVGGVFAPALFTGGILGNLFARVANQLNWFGHSLPLASFTLVAMAGLVAGVLHAPLTAIFLIAELTGGYTLFIPLMIVASTAFALSKYYLKHSLYTKRLALEGNLITHDKDQKVLTLMDIDSVIEKNFIAVEAEMSLGELIEKAVVKSNRNIFPVVETQSKHLIGIILLDDIRSIMFNRSMYESITVKDLMHAPPEIIHLEKDKMTQIMQKFQDTAAWNLPVVRNGAYVGFVSKSKLLTAYRRKLIYFST